MIKYPIGLQDFKGIRTENYLYVDKTRFIRILLERGKYYFLGRPRRFGKSLFLSTLEYFFKGERDLFRGLDIETFDWDWQDYPLIRIDLGPKNYQKEDSLTERLDSILSRYENQWGLQPSNIKDIEGRFENLIRFSENKYGRKVVVLVDEYEKPVTDTLEDEILMTRNREILRGFYSVLKSLDSHLKFVFLTGVTKYGQISIFSGNNNIFDISLDDLYSSICGVTQEELVTTFKEGIEELAQEMDTDFEGALKLLKENYDGYHFSLKCKDIYNPFSLMQALAKKSIEGYWVASGTPRILADALKRKDYDLSNIMNSEASANQLMDIDPEFTDPVALLYQTGYLTIKGYDRLMGTYRLGYPNREVEQAFFNYLLPAFANRDQSHSASMMRDLVRAILNGEARRFVEVLESFSAGISYDLIPKNEVERHFQSLIYIICKLIMPYTVATEVEHKTSDGRIDLLIRTEKFIYIIEIKRDSCAEEALNQIEEKKYDSAFKGTGQKIFRIGINFSSEKKRIDGFAIG